MMSRLLKHGGGGVVISNTLMMWGRGVFTVLGLGVAAAAYVLGSGTARYTLPMLIIAFGVAPTVVGLIADIRRVLAENKPASGSQ